MENVPYQGQTLTRWRVGNSTFLALPEKGARLMSWTITLGDGSVREVLYWPENANISPPHSPTPISVLSVSGAAGEKAISLQSREKHHGFPAWRMMVNFIRNVSPFFTSVRSGLPCFIAPRPKGLATKTP